MMRSAALVLLACTLGCGGRLVDVNVLVVGEQTALEKQVLGSYRGLGTDLAAYSSVRGVEPDGTLRMPPPATESEAAAMRAMQSRAYNRDDVESLLAAGAMGEGNDGLLVLRRNPPVAVGTISPPEIERIVEEENIDRRVLLERLRLTVPGLRPDQHGEVAWIFARLNRDAAPVGSPIQERDGTWRTK